MMPVPRRVVPVVFVMVMLALGACAGADRSVASVGDETISRDELLNYSSVFQQIDLTATHPAPALRAAAQAWIQDAATVQALSSNGIELEDAQRLQAEQLLQQAIEAGEVLPVTPSSAGYEYIVRRAWLLGEPRAGDPAVQDAVIQLLLDDVEVSSRLGRWNPATLQIAPIG